MTNSTGSTTGLRRVARLGLMCCAGMLALGAGKKAYAEPVFACPGVTVSSYDGTGIVDTSSLAVGCAVIPGAELSMDGAVAPLVNFGEPSGQVTTLTYDADNEILVETDVPHGSTSTTYDMVYDSNGRLTSETTYDTADPLGLTTTYTYDPNGDLITEISPLDTTSYTYDAQDRLIQDTDRSRAPRSTPMTRSAIC
jgi:YD repeat-containing protein